MFTYQLRVALILAAFCSVIHQRLTTEIGTRKLEYHGRHWLSNQTKERYYADVLIERIRREQRRLGVHRHLEGATIY